MRDAWRNQLDSNQNEELNRIRKQNQSMTRGNQQRGTRGNQQRVTPENQWQQRRQGRGPKPGQVHEQPRGYNEKTAVCYRCGDPGHYGRNCVKTKGMTCYDCGGKDHMAKMCKSKQVRAINMDVADRDEVFTFDR